MGQVLEGKRALVVGGGVMASVARSRVRLLRRVAPLPSSISIDIAPTRQRLKQPQRASRLLPSSETSDRAPTSTAASETPCASSAGSTSS